LKNDVKFAIKDVICEFVAGDNDDNSDLEFVDVMVVHELQVRVDMVDNDEIMVDNDPHRPD
jgi:hypothetical protein